MRAWRQIVKAAVEAPAPLLVGIVLAMVLGGCFPGYMNQAGESQLKLKESETAKAVATSDLKLRGPAPITVTQTGEGATATIAPPEATEVQQIERRETGQTSTGSQESEATFSSKNPFTLILLGAGLILVVFAGKYLWTAIQNTTAGKAIAVADTAGKRLVDALKARMQEETDAAKLAALKDAVIAAEATRDTVVVPGSVKT